MAIPWCSRSSVKAGCNTSLSRWNDRNEHSGRSSFGLRRTNPKAGRNQISLTDPRTRGAAAGTIRRAGQNLRSNENVSVVSADGSLHAAGLFDAIFVNAGCTRPQSIWLDQLAIGERLLVPLTVSLPASPPGIGSGFMLLITRREAEY